MPKRIPVKSLKTLAEENIVKNVDNFWCVKYLRDWGDKHLLFVEGPFDCLGPEACHKILNELARKKVLKRHHIYLLINPVSLKSHVVVMQSSCTSLFSPSCIVFRQFGLVTDPGRVQDQACS